MADQMHLAKLTEGVAAWNEWRQNNANVAPDLSGADLRSLPLPGRSVKGHILRLDLRRANLLRADLSGLPLLDADFTDAMLQGADLKSAKLQRADMTRAFFQGASLNGCDLYKANLNGAFLAEASFLHADLRNCSFKGAVFAQTLLCDSDLSQSDGLEDAMHAAPNVLDFVTLRRSGRLPLPFLLGVGIPAEVGESVWATTGARPAPYCFISHSTADRVFIDRLVSDLKNNEVLCWYFPENATWGLPVWEEIGKGISTADKVIIVCSKSSLNSGPVLRELERTLQREDKEHKHILLPLYIDDYLLHAWNHSRQPDVVLKVVGDLRGWDVEANRHKAGADRLLQSLRRR